ncbi:MAG TPA: site-specific DNA-methyltransferase [Kineosporiaceae bacterium]|nr:site-specific DNA-methyltransferase [Kineosporiaceae bacterium]
MLPEQRSAIAGSVRPYWTDGVNALYLGRFEDILPSLDVRPDLIVADPPYQETDLSWDRWPDGWPDLIADIADSMWCFGSMRMFLERGSEFARWRLSQDVVWEKQNGTGSQTDRFKRVHEHALHWYRGDWSTVHHQTPTTPDAIARTVRHKARPAHWHGATGPRTYTVEDGGPRLMRSVVYARNMHGRAINETEKPTGLLEPLITYGCPPGGLVLDPFSGSGSTIDAARATGRRCIGIEMRESQCEEAARRLSQDCLPLPLGEQ